MSSDQNISEGQPALAQAAFLGLCPRCGKPTLFAGRGPLSARFASSCTACGLDFSAFNVGDGPAAFLTMVIGALDVVLALWAFFRLGLPVWAILLALVPVTFGLVLWGLRVSKAALLATEYRRRAFEAGKGDLRGD